MNKLFLNSFAAFMMMAVNACAAEVKKLPEPDLEMQSASLMQLLDERQSGRSYDIDKRIDDTTLSEILWSAAGVNQYGKITIPTARNNKNLLLFIRFILVLIKCGVLPMLVRLIKMFIYMRRLKG